MISVCTFHSLIARRWRDRRIFIAGDAAHQTPPFLGQGMCAGIRDAANLAWKFACPDWLDSYQSERAPHGRVFPQPVLADGRRLDQAIGGYRWAVLCPPQLRTEAPMTVVPFAGEEAIVLRPDRYVYGRAKTKGQLEQLLGGVRYESKTPQPHH